MTTHRCLALVLPVLLACNAGCSHIIKRSFKEAKGAKAQAIEVPGTLTTDFSDFKAVEVGEPGNRLGGLVLVDFYHSLRPMLVKYLAQEEGCPFPGGSGSGAASGPVLRVDSDIMWYHDRGGGLAAVLGKDSFAIGLFTLSYNGEEVGRVQVVTKSGASRTEAPDMAEAMARGLARFIVRVRDGISEDDQEKAEREREKQRQRAAEQSPDEGSADQDAGEAEANDRATPARR